VAVAWASVATALCASASASQAASTFYITGAGNGHGIGMSQYGAYGYALHGWTYRQILGHYYQGTGIGTTSTSQLVRVLVGTGNYGPPTFTGASLATAPRAGNQTVNLSTTLRYWMKALSGGNVALYDTSGQRLISVRPPLVVSGPGPLDFSGHGHYRGSFEFRWEWGLMVQTVNAVDLEDYVRGVVSAEMPASWSGQALEAQAVAARTYAITTSVSGNGYTLYSDTRSQMYEGVAAETPSTDTAVANTRGQVVTDSGTPAATYFFASSGGYTESVQNVWLGSSPEPWLRGVPDPYDDTGGNPYYRWSESMSMDTAAARLGPLVKGNFEGITVTRRGVSPRVVTATVNGSGGTTEVTGPQLQGIFGLLSTHMSFSTISTIASPPRATGDFRRLAMTTPALQGYVRPAAPGAVVDVQELVGGHWRTITQAPLGAGGRYSVRVGVAGRYRVVFGGLGGPVVSVGLESSREISPDRWAKSPRPPP
jgi:stage II sporulation protein D